MREEQSWQPSTKPIIEEPIQEEKSWDSNEEDFELEELEEEVREIKEIEMNGMTYHRFIQLDKCMEHIFSLKMIKDYI